MPENIRERPTFLMITDTAMVRKNGNIFAFGPVVRELDVFLILFENIVWIGFDRPDLQDDPVMMQVPEAVKCILLKRTGGKNLINKIGVFLNAPIMLIKILNNLSGIQVVHTRAPSSPAFLAAILSLFFSKKIWWHKYAGNWGQINPPYFYGLQRKWLAWAKWSKVSINGRWSDQPSHCLSFANPCLDEQERQLGAKLIQLKNYQGKLDLCFVGRLEAAKGIDKLMEALKDLSKERISTIHLIGDGPLKKYCEEIAEILPFKIKLYGQLSRQRVGEVMADCHVLILPSKAEGFPKVIAEGANYGCVPVVSDISGISQYIQQGENGFLLSPNRLNAGFLAEDLLEILTHPKLKSIAEASHTMAADFTFNKFKERIEKEIIGVN